MPSNEQNQQKLQRSYEQALESTILRVEVGSTIHGTNLEEADDRDELAIYVEHPDEILGLQRADTIIYRTAEGGVVGRHALNIRSRPGDLDLAMHPLGKFSRMAKQGNPTVMLAFFSPKILRLECEGEILRGLYQAFVSKRLLEAFAGYMDDQYGRLTGEKGNKRVNRPELIAKHGFDTKYASHVIRLGLQGMELAETGGLKLPLRGRETVLVIRRGEMPYDDVVDLARALRADLRHAVETSAFPDETDDAAINKGLREIYHAHWQRRLIQWPPFTAWRESPCQHCGVLNRFGVEAVV